mmetsp:Transcript_3549/g.8703  ORF Transcript_3549/g.8703 Transcript_3549/m.8703 type:complete len:375 (-) Transcript_3549:4584-5708(-)
MQLAGDRLLSLRKLVSSSRHQQIQCLLSQQTVDDCNWPALLAHGEQDGSGLLDLEGLLVLDVLHRDVKLLLVVHAEPKGAVFTLQTHQQRDELVLLRVWNLEIAGRLVHETDPALPVLEKLLLGDQRVLVEIGFVVRVDHGGDEGWEDDVVADEAEDEEEDDCYRLASAVCYRSLRSSGFREPSHGAVHVAVGQPGEGSAEWRCYACIHHNISPGRRGVRAAGAGGEGEEKNHGGDEVVGARPGPVGDAVAEAGEESRADGTEDEDEHGEEEDDGEELREAGDDGLQHRDEDLGAVAYADQTELPEGPKSELEAVAGEDDKLEDADEGDEEVEAGGGVPEVADGADADDLDERLENEEDEAGQVDVPRDLHVLP